MEYCRRLKIPEEVIEHPELEQLDSEYSWEYLVEPDLVEDQTEVGQKEQAVTAPLSGVGAPAPEGGRGFVFGGSRILHACPA